MFPDHRDHTQCCTDKGIAEVCLSICRGEIPDFAALPQLDQCLGRIEDILWCAEDGQSKSRPCGWGGGGKHQTLLPYHS